MSFSSDADGTKWRTSESGHKTRVSDKCDKCGSKENLKNCSKCHTVAYCGRECQVSDWPKHKQICKFFAKMGKATNEMDW